MTNPPANTAAAIDQEVLNRIVKEVFERLGTSSGGSSSLEAQISHEHGVSSNPRKIPVGVSVRHVHISQKDLETLFGPGATLHQMRELYQKGEFAAEETVSLVGPKMGVLEKVRILGPTRDRTQVENSPHRRPYSSASTHRYGCQATSRVPPRDRHCPKGVIELADGCIRAMRHIHMNPREAANTASPTVTS